MGIGVTNLEVRFAEKVVSVVPSRIVVLHQRQRGNAHAVRLARGLTGRRNIVKVQGGFQDGVTRRPQRDLGAGRAYGCDPLSKEVSPDRPGTMITEFNNVASVEQAFAEHGDVAAVIREPIPHDVGTMRPTQEYLEALRQITWREGALLIFDEVITGFRHAFGGYQRIAGFAPISLPSAKRWATGPLSPAWLALAT